MGCPIGIFRYRSLKRELTIGYGGGGGVEWVGCYCIWELGYGGIETGKADGLVGFTSSEFNCIFTTPWSNERYD